MGMIAVEVGRIRKEAEDMPDVWGGGMLGEKWGPGVTPYTGPPKRPESIAQRTPAPTGASGVHSQRMAEQRNLLRNYPREVEEVTNKVIEYGQQRVDKMAAFAAEEHEMRRRGLDATGEEYRSHTMAMLAFTESQKQKELEIRQGYDQLMAQTRVTSATNEFDRMQSQQDLELQGIKAHYDQVHATMKKAGAEESTLKAVQSAKAVALDAAEKKQRLATIQWTLGQAKQYVSQIGSTLEGLYQSGLARNKKMFRVIQGFKIVEAVINTAAAIMQALSSWPPPISYALAAVSAAMGAAQIAIITKQKPPEYYEGGIVRGSQRGSMIRAGERYRDEAVIPLRGGGVPVQFMGQEGPRETKTEIHEHYHFENSQFMDQRQLAATLDTVAVSAVQKDYRQGGRTRTMVRRRK
jgi:hypothetical protein